jgi:hypothetical protein
VGAAAFPLADDVVALAEQLRGALEVQIGKGWSAAPVRHGVSVLRSGRRYTLGVLFHDAP